MNIIVGLGNPGKKYKNTRHNIGFMVADALAKKLNLSWQSNKKFNAQICKTPHLDHRALTLPRHQRLVRGKTNDTVIVKPQTYVNNSGRSAQAILSYYKLLPRHSLLPSWLGGAGGGKDTDLSKTLTIIHDDLDIELGKYKISIDSRSAGHQGVESIINYLKTKNFTRIRIGIATEMANKIPAEKFVLQKLNKEELTTINNLIIRVMQDLRA